MAQKRGLGRGLEALLGVSVNDVSKLMTPELAAVGVTAETVQKSELQKLPIEYLQRGRFQPRKDMNPEALDELAESIKAQGIIQPIVARPIGENSYEIIAGERRWRAAQLAGLDVVPVIVRDIPDEAAMAMGLIENIQREDLNPIEEAYALQRLIDEFHMIHQEIAEAVGKSRSAITNLLRLLNLNADVKTLVEHGDLEMGHARALLVLAGEQQYQAAQVVVNKGLSVRETEVLVKKLVAGKSLSKAIRAVDPDVTTLQNNLSEKIGAKVNISHGAKGKGKVVIQYNSLDELDGILEHIK